MAFLEIFVVAVGLALDAFAVSLGAAAGGFANNPRAAFRLAFHFGLFQAVMPLIGWLVGIQVAGWVSAIDHWIAFGLLAFVGIRMIRSGLGPAGAFAADPSRGVTLVMLSVATSIDALAVGLSLAMVGVRILLPCVIIGVVAAGLSLVGIRLGSSVSAKYGKFMEVLGGVLLILIGIRILVAHMLLQ
jgi:putative Mn2+ efflux pump MntP